jgi:hypothetical protein
MNQVRRSPVGWSGGFRLGHPCALGDPFLGGSAEEGNAEGITTTVIGW